MSRLPAATYGKLIAMKAEDHYVRVYTDNGNSLVHYRFNDAVTDVAAQSGLQTHRSWWVREAEIVKLKTQGHRTHLILSSGLEVPVSRSYLNNVKRSLEEVKRSFNQAGQTGNPGASQQTLQ
jgi:DNA-binding LytR/AlgR family response regulator